MRAIPIALVLAALACPLAARAAQRSSGGVELGIGADYLVDPEVGAFMLTLAGERHLSSVVAAGIRAGALVTTSTSHVGAPVDFRLRFHGQRLYVDALAGPWFVFNSGDTLRFHGGLGIGVRTAGMTFGLEAGFLNHTGMVGLRLAFAI